MFTVLRCFRTVVAPCLMLAVLVGLGSLSRGQEGPAADDPAALAWRAGIARAKITPERALWMSGYGGRDRPAEGTLIDLWAKVLTLESADGRRLALVGLDLVGIDRQTSQAICRRLEQEYSLPRECVALFTSHTHTGPVVGRNLISMYALTEPQRQDIAQYTQRLEDDVVAAVGRALESMQPARLSWGLGKTTFAVNRRNNPEAKVPALRAAGRLVGPVDHDVPVLAVREPSEGKLRAVVFGYACHATVLSFYQWSGDWPGFAQLELEKQNPDCLALFFAGCGADQNPLPRRSVELAEHYGRQTARAVQEVLDAPMAALPSRIRAAYSETPLAFEQLPTREEIQRDAKSSNAFVVRRAKALLEQLDSPQGLPESYPYPVQVWRLGDSLRWVILGGEVTVEYSLRIKHELGRNDTWVAGYANDVMAYIPSRRVWVEGGYEGGGAMLYYGLPSRWAEDVEERVLAEVRRLSTAKDKP